VALGTRYSFWLALAAAVLSIKIALLAIDSLVVFGGGDSGAYLASAVSDWVPGDRSFTYGRYFIRAILAVFGSIKAVVVAQSLLSGATSVLAAVCLRVGFRSPFWVAAIAALLYAIEPLALLYERAILTETVTLFFLALFVLTGLSYINRPRTPRLILLAFLGTCILSLRTFHIPVVLVATVAVVLLGIPHLRDQNAGSVWDFGSRVLLHALVAIAATVGFHAAYQQYFSYVTNQPPTYNSGDGFFLIAAWAPVVTPDDFPNEATAERVLNNLFDLQDRFNRNFHLFGEGGLVNLLQKDQAPGISGYLAASEAAKKIALHAARRDPIGLIGLAVETYADYWNGKVMRKSIVGDQGPLKLDQKLIDYFQACCSEDLSKNHLQDTLAKRWYGGASVWYRVLLLSPLFAILLCIPRGYREQAMFVGVVVWAVMLVSVFFGVVVDVRFHHALAWLACIQLGILLSYIDPWRLG
jgi:hypothetical protein